MSTFGFDAIRGALLGLVVGDVLGVPAEGRARSALRVKPVAGMEEYGSHWMPAGTWSDDSSLVLATMDSLIECRGIDCNDIMRRFKLWLSAGEYTPDGSAFSCGRATARAIHRFDGLNALQCGRRGVEENGNGSLMRILPVSLYQCFAFRDILHDSRPAVLDPIHSASAITHAHPISMMGCSLYSGFVAAILNAKTSGGSDHMVGSELQASVLALQNDYKNQFGNIFADEDYAGCFSEYHRLLDIEAFRGLSESDIASGGYVVHTLEAALWGFLNSGSYEECILKAVNLGGDTDTTAAVAGGLAGAFYGVKDIPETWISVIRRLDWIEDRIEKFMETLEYVQN